MNNNKMDTQNTSGAEALRARSLASARGGEKKHRASFLLVDLLLLIGVVAVILLLVLAFTPLDLFGNDAEERQILYTVEFYGVDKEMEYAFREGDTVTDLQTGAVMGVVTQVSSRVHEVYTDTPTDEIVPEFDKYVVQKEKNEAWRVITVTIQVTAEYQAGVGYTVDANRIAVGREYQLRFPTYTRSGACVALTATGEGTVTE
jgi:hypothetical protein